MEVIAIQGHAKAKSGKEEAKRIRRNGHVPCVMYKSGGGPAIQFTAESTAFRHLVYTPDFKLAEINLDGTSHRCILKEIQFHPVSDAVIHLDFLEVVPGVKFKVNVPLRFVGSSPGVKGGGKFLAKLRNIKILTTPENLVDSMTIDISGMELGGTIRVRDIQFADGVDVLNPPAVPVASVEIPRALRGAKA